MNKIIDISEHNGIIDFNKVKNDGVEGVIIRLGWIGNKQNHTIDKKFVEYYKLAKTVGLKIGFYVYSYCESIEALRNGTNWILNQLEGKQFELPVFLDVEDSQIAKCDKENLTNQCIQFCTIIQNSGYKAGVYANKDWFLNKLYITKLLDFKIWLAEWNGKENHTLGYKVDLWQYSDNGQVQGINSRVDMNKCFCNVQEIIQKGDDEEVKVYQNGSTEEPVYSDTNLKFRIGSLNKYEKCDCLGIFNNKAIVRYRVNGTDNYKIGFVSWLGGVK